MNNRRASRLHLETTVWNFFATEKEEETTGPVTKLYREMDSKRYKMYISPLVKLKTRRLANYINLLEGYKTLEIGTPEEVIEYE
jgi:hypothetical protein